MGFRGENFDDIPVKGSHGRHGKWKRENPRFESKEPELIIPLEVSQESAERVPEAPPLEEEVSTDVATTQESENVSGEITQPTFAEIPPEQLEVLDELLNGKGGWVRTPKPVLLGFQAAGLAVHVLKRGTAEKRGDTLKIYPPDGSEAHTYTTDEAAFLLREIISNQRGREILRALEKEVVGPVETPEDDGISALTEVDIQNSTPPNEVLRERATEGAENSPEILENEESGEERDSFATDEMLRERARKMAEVRAEILKSEENEDPEIHEMSEVSVTLDTEKEPTPAQQPRTFDMRFASEFGVTKEMWEQIKGHEKLSVAQQKLVFENLREFNERDKTPYLSNVWEGVMEQIGRKKDVGPTLAALTQLVESAALYGPKVHEENGELLTDFVGLDIPRESRKEWKQAFDALNAVAHRMSKTPASWQEDGIGTHSERESKMMSFIKDSFSSSRKRYKEYQEIQASYDAQKKELSRILGEAGYEPGVIAAKLVDIDKNVHMLQFQQTSPDAVEAIKDIPDTSMWKMIGKSLCNKSNLGYMAGGAAARAVLAGAMGVFVAPTVSAAIAGKRSWDKTAAEMRERDRAARMGKKDTSGEALNIVSAEMTIDIAGEKREVGATQKLQKLLDEYRILNQEGETRGETKEYQKEMSALVDRIKVRASYMEDKQRLNRISFGNKEERPVQMAKLYETLALAQMIAADRHLSPKSALEERLGKILFQRENVLQDKRRTRQVKEASWNALRAGSFSAAGVWLASEVQEMGLGEKLGKFMGAQHTNELPFIGNAPLNAEEISRLTTDSSIVFPRPLYTVHAGDTLTKILKEQISEIQALDAGKVQNNAVANILRRLSAEELKSIGVRSGNPNLIYTGDTLNMEALYKIIKSHQ